MYRLLFNTIISLIISGTSEIYISSERNIMQKRPFNKNQVQILRKMLAENLRDFALLNTGIDTSLR